MGPFSPSPVCLSLLSLAAGAVRRPPAALGHPPRATSCSSWLPRVAQKLPTALCHRAGAPFPRHASAEASRGCHLAAAVARAAQHPGPLSIARISIPGSSTTRSPRSLARSLPSFPKPAPPFIRNPGELDAAAEPPLQLSSARADPLGSSAVGPRSSPTHPPLPIATRAPPRRSRPPPVTCFRGATSLLCLDPN